MEATPKTFTHFELVNAVRSLRGSRRSMSENNIALTGTKSDELRDQYDYAAGVAQSLLETHRNWVNRKFEPLLPYLQGEGKRAKSRIVTVRDIRDFYNRGLNKAVTIVSRASDTSLTSEEIEDTVAAYTVEFVSMLQFSERITNSKKTKVKIGPTTALNLAENSAVVNQQRVRSIFKEYSEFPTTIITYALLHRFTDPEGFMKQIRETVHRLSEDPRFMDLPQYVINNAAFKSPNAPERALETLNETLIALLDDPRYNSLPRSILIDAARLNPKNPSIYLDRVLKKREK